MSNMVLRVASASKKTQITHIQDADVADVDGKGGVCDAWMGRSERWLALARHHFSIYYIALLHFFVNLVGKYNTYSIDDSSIWASNYLGTRKVPPQHRATTWAPVCTIRAPRLAGLWHALGITPSLLFFLGEGTATRHIQDWQGPQMTPMRTWLAGLHS